MKSAEDFVFRLQHYILVSLPILIVLAYIFPGYGLSDYITAMLGVVGFLFGILSGFVITILWGRYTELRNAFNVEMGALVSIYMLAIGFGKQTRERLRKIIDKYLIVLYHYALEEYDKSDKNLEEIVRFFSNNKMRDRNNGVYDQCLSELSEISKARTSIMVLINSKLDGPLSFTINLLGFITIGLIYYAKTPNITSMILTVIFSLAVVLVLALVRVLDKLQLWEHQMCFAPGERVYDILGVKPYFHEGSVTRGAAKLKKGKVYRLGYGEKEGKYKLHKA